MKKELVKIIEYKDKIKKEKEKINSLKCECPNFDECGGIYGCPKNYKDCIEYHEK